MGQIKSNLGAAVAHAANIKSGASNLLGGGNAELDGSSHYQGNDKAKEHIEYAKTCLQEAVSAIQSSGGKIEAIANMFHETDQEQAKYWTKG